MVFTRCKFAALLTGAIASLGAASTASAQLVVVVNVEDVIDDIALDLDVDVSQIPITVQAPIGVAANVCGVAVNVLAQQLAETGTAECDAQTTSEALNRIVQREL
jgi:hypothetical protein